MHRFSIIGTIALLGCGQGTVEEVVDVNCPTLELDAASVALEDVALGEATTAPVTLRHGCRSGNGLSITVVLSSGTGFSVDQESVVLAPGDESTLNVSFTPTGYASAQSELFLFSGDPVNPKVVIPLSATVDPDQDGDGENARAVGGTDCDDLDENVNRAGEESWDGKDNDCDGTADVMPVDGAEHGFVTGESYRYLAHLGNIGIASFDGGKSDSVVISSALGYGYGYALNASDFRNFDDEAVKYSTATWGGSVGQLGTIDQHFADNTGDGIPDIAVHGIDYTYKDRGAVSLALFSGAALAREMTPEDAVLTMDAGNRYNGGVVSSADLDGNGVNEIIMTHRYSFEDTFVTSRGVALIHEVAGESGVLDAVGDRDAVIEGAKDYDYFGQSPQAADMNGDGYDDLVVGASGEDSGAGAGGMFYVIGGAVEMPDGNAKDTSIARIQGETYAGYLGFGSRPLIADVDGDEVNDLVIASVYEDLVFVFSDTSTVQGELDALDADYVIEGSDGPDYFGMGLAAGDFDQDGKPELAVGAPDTYAYRQSTVGDRGRVSVYDLTEGRITEKARFQGMGRQDTFGQTLRAWDLDGDGSDELIVDAPGHEGGGRVYFLTWTP